MTYLGSYLVTALATLDMNYFSHPERSRADCANGNQDRPSPTTITITFSSSSSAAAPLNTSTGLLPSQNVMLPMMEYLKIADNDPLYFYVTALFQDVVVCKVPELWSRLLLSHPHFDFAFLKCSSSSSDKFRFCCAQFYDYDVAYIRLLQLKMFYGFIISNLCFDTRLINSIDSLKPFPRTHLNTAAYNSMIKTTSNNRTALNTSKRTGWGSKRFHWRLLIVTLVFIFNLTHSNENINGYSTPNKVDPHLEKSHSSTKYYQNSHLPEAKI